MIPILTILQARVSSKRLPAKVLKPILQRPMLELQIERVLRSRRIDHLIIATSTDSTDDEIEALCRGIYAVCFRGSLQDVLDRYYQATRVWKPEHIVRITGDCPLIDPAVIDEVISFYLSGGYDYVSNTLEPTFPEGLDVEIFRCYALEEAWKEARLPSQREHVTPFIYQRPDRYRIGQYKNPEDLSHLRWTVDEPEDFDLASKIYEALYPENPDFRMAEVVEWLRRNPQWSAINRKFQRNEGLLKSLREDNRSSNPCNAWT
jgi:spore coat polysaccharide biosynthesis protein SpsF